jgi:hypothetical protein
MAASLPFVFAYETASLTNATSVSFVVSAGVVTGSAAVIVGMAVAFPTAVWVQPDARRKSDITTIREKSAVPDFMSYWCVMIPIYGCGFMKGGETGKIPARDS